MIILYFLLATGAYGCCCFVFDVYRLLTDRRLSQFPPDFRPPAGVGVRQPRPRPGQPSASEAVAEVEGTAFSQIP